VSDWQQLGAANVAARMRELEAGLGSVVEDVPLLVEAVGRLDGDIEHLIEARRETRTALDRHDEVLREMSATVKRLAVQVAWIEQHLRSTGSARTVDLDRADPDLIGLAAVAEAGRAAAAELLLPVERAGLIGELARNRDAVARQRAALRDVLAACERVARGEPQGAAHRLARAEYQAARDRFAEAGAAVSTTLPAAHTAREKLVADDAERERCSALIADGERAERELLTRLRTRIASAVTDGAMLPAWLTGPLGPMPVAGAAERWTDVAAGLLAYRITYGVTDPADAVGEVPTGAGERRRRWHADLGRGVRELRR